MCVLSREGDALYVGFRGSDDMHDWFSNMKFELVSRASLWPEAVKFHQGFEERAAAVLEELPARVRALGPPPCREANQCCSDHHRELISSTDGRVR